MVQRKACLTARGSSLSGGREVKAKEGAWVPDKSSPPSGPLTQAGLPTALISFSLKTVFSPEIIPTRQSTQTPKGLAHGGRGDPQASCQTSTDLLSTRGHKIQHLKNSF